jgi:sRNA-binding protein
MQILPNSSESVTPSESTTAKTQALLATLRARFPVLAEFKPLKIKIHLDIRAALEGEGIANIRIARALAWHISHGQYLKALAKGGARYNLTGEIDGEVTDEQQKRAIERRKRKKPKSPQSQTSPLPAEPSAPAVAAASEQLKRGSAFKTSPESSAPPVAASPVDTTPPDPAPTTRPVLKLKPKAGPVTNATITRKEAKP